jgi:hypothetical protein
MYNVQPQCFLVAFFLLQIYVDAQAFSTAPEVLLKKGYGMECDWYALLE